MRQSSYNKNLVYSSGFRPDSTIAKEYFAAARSRSLEINNTQSTYSSEPAPLSYPSQARNVRVPVKTLKQEQALQSLNNKSYEAKVAKALTPEELPVKVINQIRKQQQFQQEVKNINPQQQRQLRKKQNYFDEIKKEKSSSKTQKNLLAMLGVIFVLGITITGLFSNLTNSNQLKSKSAVAGAQEIKQDGTPEYISWIFEKNKSYSNPIEDLDGDGLTNEEEFKLQTNPTSTNTCNPEKTDAENLFELIDPESCKTIDLEDTDQFEKFKDILNREKLLETSVSKETVQPAEIKMNTEGFLKLFDVNNFDELEKISTETLKQQGQDSPTKLEYIKKIDRISKYIKKFRSYEPYDRDENSPVSPAKYLQVSLEYNVPLKYVLAVGRAESRFGTDKYDRSGNLTRPGESQNIYSIGLSSTGEKKYATWDEGVEGFGIWYKRFQDRGVSDCRKWKIYNPNGDYCSKIEKLSAEIEDFLNQ